VFFWLTDSCLWFELGNYKVYEYTQAMDHLGRKKPAYSDYPLIRFREDLTGLFGLLSESIPIELYQLTENIDEFLDEAQKWLDMYETDHEENNEFYFEEYDNFISWTDNRSFDSGHLIGGLCFSFFRYKDKLRIIWDTEHQLQNGIELWTAKKGSIEMSYEDFVVVIKDFLCGFLEKMDVQIDLAMKKNWGGIRIDKINECKNILKEGDIYIR